MERMLESSDRNSEQPDEYMPRVVIEEADSGSKQIGNVSREMDVLGKNKKKC